MFLLSTAGGAEPQRHLWASRHCTQPSKFPGFYHQSHSHLCSNYLICVKCIYNWLFLEVLQGKLHFECRSFVPGDQLLCLYTVFANCSGRLPFSHRGRNSFSSPHLFDHLILHNTYKLFTSTVQWRRYWTNLTSGELFKYLFPLSFCTHLAGCTVLHMLVNVALINKWEFLTWPYCCHRWWPLFFFYCDNEASRREGAQKQRSKDMADGSGALPKMRSSVRQIGTHESFIKQKWNNIFWLMTVIHSSGAGKSYSTHSLSPEWLLQLKY